MANMYMLIVVYALFWLTTKKNQKKCFFCNQSGISGIKLMYFKETKEVPHERKRNKKFQNLVGRHFCGVLLYAVRNTRPRGVFSSRTGHVGG